MAEINNLVETTVEGAIADVAVQAPRLDLKSIGLLGVTAVGSVLATWKAVELVKAGIAKVKEKGLLKKQAKEAAEAEVEVIDAEVIR